MKTVRVACVQFAPQPNALTKNLHTICDWFDRAVSAGADLVVFPETSTTGFTTGLTREDLYALLPTSIEDYLHPLCEHARHGQTACILPTYERGLYGGAVFNSAYVISKTGTILGAYRKTHLFPTERLTLGGWSTPGGAVPVFSMSFGTLGVMICYDGDFPELGRMLAIQGATILIRSAAFLRDFTIWELTNRARAYENDVHLVAVNTVGVDQGGQHYYGHSMIVAPSSRVLVQAGAGEELLIADLTPSAGKGQGDGRSVNHLRDRNVQCYGESLFKDLSTQPRDGERGTKPMKLQTPSAGKNVLRPLAEEYRETRCDLPTLLKLMSAALELDLDLRDTRHVFTISGRADLQKRELEGSLIVGRDFVKDLEVIGDLSRDVAVQFLEYTLSVSAGKLLPLILTGGTDAEAFTAGQRLLGYGDADAIPLLASKEFVAYIRALRNQHLFKVEEHLASVAVEYDTDYWDELTEAEVEAIFNGVRELADRHRKDLLQCKSERGVSPSPPLIA